MHRLKSPLVALIAVLIAAGPLAGRISQPNANDTYQVSTPSAWERSRQETVPAAEPAFRFDHSELADNSWLSRRYKVGDDLLLVSPTEVAYVQLATMAVLWTAQPDFEIERISTLSEGKNPRIVLSGATTCAMLDAATGEHIWEQTECSAGVFSLRDNGVILHDARDEKSRMLRLLDEATGEERWSYRYVDLGRGHIVSEEQQIIYFFTTSSVDAVSMDTGEVLWTAPIVAEIDVMLLPSHLVVLRNEEIIALDPASGAEIWLSFVEPSYVTWPDYAQPETGEKLLVSMDSSVVVLDMTTGLELARYEDAQVNAISYTDKEGNYVYPGTFTLRIGNDSVGINWQTLEEGWKVSNTGGLSPYDWAYNDVQLMSTTDNRILLIDIRTGRSLLTVETTDYSSTNDGDTLLFRYEQRVEAYDTIGKRKLWTYAPPDELRRVNNTSEHVLVTTLYAVYVLDARSGEVVKETAHPDFWESLRLSTKFIFYWDGSSVTAVHHLTGTRTTFEGVYLFDDLDYWTSGDVWYVTYPLGIALLDVNTGRSLYTSDTPIDFHSNSGEFVLLSSGNEHDTVRFVEPSGEIRWELDVPFGFIEVTYYRDDNKVLLQASTHALLIDASTGAIIMDIPIAYNPDGENDALYISEADAILVGSDAESVIYQAPAPTVAELAEVTVIRGAPSASAVERGTFPAETPVFPTGNTRERGDGLWIEVRVEDITGWVREDAVTGSAATPVATP